MTPFRDRTLALLDDREQLDAIISDGTERARAIAEATLRDVVDRVGFLPGSRARVLRCPPSESPWPIPEPWAAGAAGLPDLDR